jgi:hypothetical protein
LRSEAERVGQHVCTLAFLWPPFITPPGIAGVGLKFEFRGASL